MLSQHQDAGGDGENRGEEVLITSGLQLPLPRWYASHLLGSRVLLAKAVS